MRGILDTLANELADEYYNCSDYGNCTDYDYLNSIERAYRQGDAQAVRDLVMEYDRELGSGQFARRFGNGLRDDLLTYDVR